MEVYNYPVPFCVIRDCFSQEVVQKIKEELTAIRPELLDRSQTASARTFDGKLSAKRRGIFLTECDRLKVNTILTKPFENLQNPGFIEMASQKGAWFINYLRTPYTTSTLVSLFEDGDEYKYHTDLSTLSVIYYVFEGEFEGGDFFLDQVKVPIDNNSLIIFPSCVQHRVTQLVGPGSRWSITTFVNLINPQPHVPIQRFKNFLSIADAHQLDSEIENFTWKCTGVSDERELQKPNPRRFWNCDLNDNTFFSEYLFNKIPHGPWTLERVYANGQAYGQDGNFHKDSEDQNAWTFILYANHIPADLYGDWGGETEFNTLTHGHVLEHPEYNKAVLFPAGMVHRGLSPKKNYNDLRITIAWKLIKKSI